MSIYVMTLGELAKKRGEPVGDFVKKVQSLGFEAGSHAKKLTQADLNSLIGLLDGGSSAEEVQQKAPTEKKELTNPNVLLVKLPNGKRSVVLVDASINELGKIEVEIVEHSTEDTLGEALLEFRKQLGLNLGVN
jgi:hypothetical protein